MIEEFHKIRELRDRIDKSHATTIVAVLATALGCNYKGVVRHVEVCDVVLQTVDAGCDALALADTTGHATPDGVRELIEALLPFCGNKLSVAHFNNTCRLGLANVAAALQYGIREFDSSLAGIGSPDVARGACGNIVTEDLVYMLESMGYRTGIDLRMRLDGRAILQRTFAGESLEGFIARVGVPDDFQRQTLL